MKIEKTDLVLMAASAVAMVILMLFATEGKIISSLIIGVNSGIGGGCLACIFRRWLKRKQTEKA